MPKAAKSGAVKKVIHPNSRAAAQLARKAHRDQRLDKNNKTRYTKLELQGQRLLWFSEHVDPDAVSYTKEEVSQLIEEYFNRFDEELEQIGIVQGMKGRSGDQHASRKDAINMTLEQEQKEYEGLGFEIVDLTNAKNYKSFLEWNGELRFIQNLKLKKYKPVTEPECVQEGNKKDEQTGSDGSNEVCVKETKPAHPMVADKCSSDAAKKTSVTGVPSSSLPHTSDSTNRTESMETGND